MIVTMMIVAFLFAAVLTRYLSGSPRVLVILDHPNSRSLHQQPVPRSGGLAVLCGFLVGGLLIATVLVEARPVFGIGMIGLIPLVIVSFLDDCRGVAAHWRVSVHVWAAGSLLAAGLVPDHIDLLFIAPQPLTAWIAIPLAGLLIVWMINLYNFMDGMDGFASGMAVIGFGALACLGQDHAVFVSVCLAVAAASTGFWVYNFPPAKIFLGDVGSTSLGFLVAACSLWGAKLSLFPLWVALFVFSPFIVDATVTLLRRLLRGEKIWQPHRGHYYQRLVLLGWGHRRTVLTEYGLMLACAASALLAVQLSPAAQGLLVIFWILFYGFLMWSVGWLERHHAAIPSGDA